MFNTASGIILPCPVLLKEEYSLSDREILLNLSFEKMYSFVFDYIEMLVEPLFIVLQLPVSLDEERSLRNNDTDTLHKGVYYLDGQSKKQVVGLLKKYGGVILNDGISEFGVASHNNGDELFIGKYKVMRIFSKNLDKYQLLMKKYGVPRVKHILVPQETFSAETPGEAIRVSIDGFDIFSVHKELMKLGMYKANVIED